MKDQLGKSLNGYKNIIFDLGGVLLNLDYNKTVEEFKRHIPNLDESTFFGKEQQLSFFSLYEVGKISTSEFKHEFTKYYNIELSSYEFDFCWNAMIYDFPLERILLLERLKKMGKAVFLLSNINELHELAVESSFSKLSLQKKFMDHFDKIYYSHRIGLRKPTFEIYDFVKNENSFRKSETLFIDDSIHHVIGAKNFGIDAIHLQKTQNIEKLDIFCNGDLA